MNVEVLILLDILEPAKRCGREDAQSKVFVHPKINHKTAATVQVTKAITSVDFILMPQKTGLKQHTYTGTQHASGKWLPKKGGRKVAL